MVLRVACLGAGYFSQFHTGSWQRIARAELVGVCDSDLARARAVGAPAFTDLGMMLAETKPDVLDIIVPSDGHADAIRAAIDAGIKAIICQKPFCTSRGEAAVVADLARTAGCHLIVHENFRFQPWYRAIKAQLDAGAIGEVIQATFRLRPGDGQGPDAYLDRQPYFRQMPRLLIHETGVHFIDVFRYLLGDPTEVYAELRKVNPVIAGEDAAYVIMTHPNGVRSVLDGNRCLDHAADNTRRTMGEGLIEGTQGVLTLTGDGAVRQRAFGATEDQIVVPPDLFDGFGGDCTHALQTHVVEGLLDGTQIENAAHEYLFVIAAEEAVYKSSAHGRRVTI